MKSLTTAFIIAVGLHPTACQAGVAARPVTEMLEAIGKACGRAPSKGAAEALEAAFKAEGQTALNAARHGGIDLVEAAAKHGEEIYKIAGRMPDAAAALGAKADELMPLIGRYGDEVLRLESRIAGSASRATQSFPDQALLTRLNALPSDQAEKVIGFSAKATDAAAPKALLEAVEKNGSTVLERLSPAQIRATGLSLAMVTAATSGPIAATGVPVAAAGDAKGFLENLLKPVGQALAASIVLVTLGVMVAACVFGRRLLRKKRR